MAFDWREFLTLARSLRDDPPPGVSLEAAQRTVASRAYYGAFGHARKYATDYLGFVPRDDGDDHGRLRAHLKRQRRGKTADCLDRLREFRNECDYLDDLPRETGSAIDEFLDDSEYVFESLPTPKPSGG